jgi:hypothetical protein
LRYFATRVLQGAPVQNCWPHLLSDEAIKDTVEKVGDDLKVLSLRVKT